MTENEIVPFSEAIDKFQKLVAQARESDLVAKPMYVGDNGVASAVFVDIELMNLIEDALEELEIAEIIRQRSKLGEPIEINENTFLLHDEDFEKFEKRLDQPTKDNPGLRRLFDR
jgi:hypothetical protein